MAQVTGVVEATSNKFSKFSVLVDGTWYATKEEWAPNPRPNKGDTITFDDGGGKFLKRCKVTTGGTVTPLAKPVDSGRYRKNGEAGGFPVHPLAYERTLDRRNATQVAATIVSNNKAVASLSVEDVTDMVLDVARKIEAYTTGDIERMKAEAMFEDEELERAAKEA